METKTPEGWLAAQLSGIRKRKQWSQARLAERLTELGSLTEVGGSTHQTVIAKIETGTRKVTVDEAFRLAAALDVSPLTLLLPRDDVQGVQIVPDGLPFTGRAVHAWITGDLSVTTMSIFFTDDPTSVPEGSVRTFDGRPISEAERRDRTRFYDDEVSDRTRRMRQTPGVQHLLHTAARLAEAVSDEREPGEVRLQLDTLAAEIERQREALGTREES